MTTDYSAKAAAAERDRIALPPVHSALFAENETLVPAAEFPPREKPGMKQLDAILRGEVR